MIPKETRILVVDDMDMTRQLVKSTLRGLGFANVTFAKDGQDALKTLKEAYALGEPIEFVISDWVMPKMDGLTMAKTLRTQKEFANLPIVFLSQNDRAEDRKQALGVGGARYLTKPFTRADLEECLGSFKVV